MVQSAVLAAREQTRSLEHPQVLGDGGQRHRERARELSDGRVGGARQPGQDRPAGGVGESREGRVQGVQIFNHMVNY
jgi:hypothetical protein